ncbi:glutamate carboxypeptidase, M20 family [Sulfurimonas gotlandica GD1]|uniref:Glutamate carboxypeptidase, M20 family n=1 Tax=Sulfurimonas gotlandica (strain DSM 19862 / JCM 16533 / GD1) TaxID=929558 RepID=B6BMC9_SULGG|nr:M20 family metallopeptidase [Sulfurimonas gotlandica]EDZ61814.1 peptidase dimerisation domain protein [Sulfurimonas gotlandica GD1]EHP29293.1 glutamate carboxypeptidase, M20 family [Sulfurimonas gotlandica GD1]
MRYLNDLSTIVNINSHTKNKHGVDRVGQIFDKWFEELGFDVNIYDRELIGNHRHYTSIHDKTAKKLLLLGHLDTVFPPNEFEEYSEDKEWIYGPGVCDMKGGNIVALQALRELKEQNIDIKNIDVFFVSDEETGSDDSKHLTAKLASDYNYCFVYEAAGENMEVVTGRKGVGTFFIDIKGKAAHAGNNYVHGHDANLEASYKLQELVKLTDLEKGTTVNVGKINGGIGANTISPYANMVFELRYKNSQERDRVLRAIDEIVNKSFVNGTTSELSGGIQRDVMQTSESSLALIKYIEDITSTTLKSEERGGVSDANIVSSCGVVTLDGFGPFGDGDHTIHERASKKSFETRIELSKKLFTYFVKNLDFKKGN